MKNEYQKVIQAINGLLTVEDFVFRYKKYDRKEKCYKLTYSKIDEAYKEVIRLKVFKDLITNKIKVEWTIQEIQYTEDSGFAFNSKQNFEDLFYKIRLTI